MDGNGKIELSGLASADLVASAKGHLHFDWRQGSVVGHPGSSITVPLVLAKFDHWTGEGDIANGVLTIQKSLVQRGPHASMADFTITLSTTPAVTFATPKPAVPSRR